MQFEHDRRPAIVNLIIWIIAAVWLMVILAYLPQESLLFIVIVGVILAIAVLVIGVSPLLTRHEVVDGNIVLRQGWHYKLVIPTNIVKRLQRLERIEAKEGVILDAFNRTLVMTDSKVNGIRLEIKEPLRVPAAFWKKVDMVIFDVTDPERFVAEVTRSL
jgi:membrane protein YdbS with pleckstrin-like domain